MTIELTPHIVKTQKGKGQNYVGPFHNKKEADEWVIFQARNEKDFDNVEVIPLQNPFEEAA